MSNRLQSLRWQIAQRIAPWPIMIDPLPGDGAFVVQRSAHTTAAYRLDRLDIQIDNSLDPRRLAVDKNELSAWGGSRRLRFTGTGTR